MSNFTAPICLEPRFSKRLALVLMGIHGGALLLLLPLALPITVELAVAVKLCLGLWVLASALYTVRRHLLFINHPLYGCILRYDEISNCIRVQLKSGIPARIVSGSLSHPQLIVLKLKPIKHGKIHHLIIFPDASDVQTFRQLRVHLRHADNPPE